MLLSTQVLTCLGNRTRHIKHVTIKLVPWLYHSVIIYTDKLDNFFYCWVLIRNPDNSSKLMPGWHNISVPTSNFLTYYHRTWIIRISLCVTWPHLTTAGRFAESWTGRAFMDCFIQGYSCYIGAVIVLDHDGFICDCKVKVEGWVAAVTHEVEPALWGAYATSWSTQYIDSLQRKYAMQSTNCRLKHLFTNN